ncbi:hypothetical protein PIIN_04007 [Serendipita indica DSM 11827]|uniref:Polysaccharide lyase 14 domain-containing protein n=1 Tax=Serendipita indica (strain DSM 11827) TaxID=1109443 RepID=G4TFI6_SERID|nr:hypothetical protein PIIN_04007 [Serendipita indica DSM 11827]
MVCVAHVNDALLVVLVTTISSGTSFPVAVLSNDAQISAPTGRVAPLLRSLAPFRVTPIVQEAQENISGHSSTEMPATPLALEQSAFATITRPDVMISIEEPSVTVMTTNTETVTTRPSPPHASGSFPFSPFRSIEWTLPSQYGSLDDAFGIHHFAYGRENLSTEPTSGGTSLLKVTYPRGSYSPSHYPKSGRRKKRNVDEEMLQRARNVTFEYSVWFPPEFDFVKGGKLPGLYGGHEKCSGGDDGLGCFSTRLMWRGDGKGELYLYARKDVQSPSLCATPPRSACNSVYGLSIGRGSFTFKRSSWTRVKQTVWLNTPGINDGGFVLEVGYDDGPMQVVMSNAEVYYRSATVPDYSLSSWEIDDMYSEDDDPDRQLSSEDVIFSPMGSVPPLIFHGQERLHVTKPVTVTIDAIQGMSAVTHPNLSTGVSTAVVSVTASVSSPSRSERPFPVLTRADPTEDSTIGFSGIFFRQVLPHCYAVNLRRDSTFFGGSTPDWASPRDQYAWFKEFRLAINA